MDPPARKEKSKVKEPAFRVEKAKQKSAQQELKQRQRAELCCDPKTCRPRVSLPASDLCSQQSHDGAGAAAV
ncbi:coiled-coil domain containing 23, isoform CRA_a [Mus musculus]|uniref:Small vasohibin binding protein n=1 Tax=Mus musculus TaxID=10090 RepID=A2A7Q0_MOUSE|nr:coiled-coil domain containing 23, isoform CRA_a [Mus musculus]